LDLVDCKRENVNDMVLVFIYWLSECHMSRYHFLAVYPLVHPSGKNRNGFVFPRYIGARSQRPIFSRRPSSRLDSSTYARPLAEEEAIRRELLARLRLQLISPVSHFSGQEVVRTRGKSEQRLHVPRRRERPGLPPPLHAALSASHPARPRKPRDAPLRRGQ
jgi:hypothetical protein